jgi:exonuclease SbcD
MRILHFADAHIDISAHGRRDPISGLPVRVLDFLHALDTIVDTAIDEKVDLVLFAGDAYKDRTPVPTFQREWGKRMARLSAAKIPTLLLVGNHDLSPSVGRAHALQEFATLDVPYILVAERPTLFNPQDLFGLPLQVMAIPWLSKSGLIASLAMHGLSLDEVHEQMETRLNELIEIWWQKINPDLPVVLTAHASVQGAVFGGERSVMLGSDLILSGGLTRDPRLDYVALGHIHKPQNLNPDAHPPVIYPGSIERVDFGEAKDEKFFIIADVQHGNTRVEWRKLEGRKFIDRSLTLESGENVTRQIQECLGPREQLKDAMLRLVVNYPREFEPLIDETSLHEYAAEAFEFHFVRRLQTQARARLDQFDPEGKLSQLDLLDRYWRAVNIEKEEIETLQALAAQIMAGAAYTQEE